MDNVHIKRQGHQSDVKEVALMKANRVVASRQKKTKTNLCLNTLKGLTGDSTSTRIDVCM